MCLRQILVRLNLELQRDMRMNVLLYRYPLHHGLMNYTDTKAKCRHLKKLTCKGTLRQVFIRVYSLEIQSVMLVLSSQLC